MHNGLIEITNINDADYIELVSGETSDFTVGQIYEVKVDDGSIYTEGERYSMDNTYTANTEMFYNPKLQLKYYKRDSAYANIR
ncbi:hypothetical protein NSQ20_25425 [Paenibacillus sp. FSL K6-1122]|uniref:hypothetical protein n=1 Tax=Paenibacillus sp. FSL K6-1122 TaxID=2954512 RepID=UPI0030ECA27F